MITPILLIVGTVVVVGIVYAFLFSKDTDFPLEGNSTPKTTKPEEVLDPVVEEEPIIVINDVVVERTVTEKPKTAPTPQAKKPAAKRAPAKRKPKAKATETK